MSIQIQKQEVQTQKTYKKVFAHEFIGGTVGGALSVIAGHPLDTIRVRIQESQLKDKVGMMTQAYRAISQDGVFSLFRGMLSPLTGVPILMALNFASFGMLKKMCKIDELQGYQDYTGVAKLLFCAGTTGFLQSFICSPIELFKILMQSDQTFVHQGVNPRQGSWGVFKYVYTNQGLRGVYKGLGVTIMKDIPGYGVYFTSQQWLKTSITHLFESKTNLSEYVDDVQKFSSCLAGGFAGMLAWMTVYPLDVLKTRYQTDFKSQKYRNFYDCYKQNIKLEGSHKFIFNGFAPTMIRAFPMNVIRFYGYELCMRHLQNQNYQH